MKKLSTYINEAFKLSSESEMFINTPLTDAIEKLLNKLTFTNVKDGRFHADLKGSGFYSVTDAIEDLKGFGGNVPEPLNVPTATKQYDRYQTLRAVTFIVNHDDKWYHFVISLEHGLEWLNRNSQERTLDILISEPEMEPISKHIIDADYYITEKRFYKLSNDDANGIYRIFSELIKKK